MRPSRIPEKEFIFGTGFVQPPLIIIRVSGRGEAMRVISRAVIPVVIGFAGMNMLSYEVWGGEPSTLTRSALLSRILIQSIEPYPERVLAGLPEFISDYDENPKVSPRGRWAGIARGKGALGLHVCGIRSRKRYPMSRILSGEGMGTGADRSNAGRW